MTATVPPNPELSSNRPSILAVTSEIPWPLDSGGHLRTYHVLRTLATQFRVRLVVPSVGGRSVEAAALAAAGLEPRLVAVSPRTAFSESSKVIAAALRREPYVLFGRHRHGAVLRALQDEVMRQQPDVIYLDHLDSLVYAQAAPGIPIIVDMHNVYSRLMSRASAEAGGILRKRYFAGEARRLARMERRAASIAHTILAVSDEEAQYFSAIGAERVAVVPNGVDCAAYEHLPVADRTGPPTIAFVSSLAWPPNINAARFLITDVLPSVRRSIPDARLAIVGRNPPDELMALARKSDHVEIAGNVPDVIPYLRAAHVLAVPLQAGGGTRLKILEAFAAGVPVVSTPVGCEGLETRDGTHLVVADRAAFADAVVGILQNRDRARVLAQNAPDLARRRYDWSAVGAAALDAASLAAALAPRKTKRPSPRGTADGNKREAIVTDLLLHADVVRRQSQREHIEILTPCSSPMTTWIGAMSVGRATENRPIPTLPCLP